MNKITRLTQICTLTLAVCSGIAHADTGARSAAWQPSGFAAFSLHDIYWANAQDSATTDALASRARVAQELSAAQQSGQIRTSFLGRTQPAWLGSDAGMAQTGAPAARAAVRAELAAAQSAGDLPVGFAGRSPRALFPGQYPTAEATHIVAHNVAHNGSSVSLNSPQ
jgi:hypothetical protein